MLISNSLAHVKHHVDDVKGLVWVVIVLELIAFILLLISTPFKHKTSSLIMVRISGDN